MLGLMLAILVMKLMSSSQGIMSVFAAKPDLGIAFNTFEMGAHSRDGLILPIFGCCIGIDPFG
jgi:hypothetical protein